MSTESTMEEETESGNEASIVANVGDIERMINETSLSGSNAHDDLYLSIDDSGVTILQAAPGDVILTYGSLYQDFFEVIEPSDEPMEAIIRVEKTLQFLGMASSDGTVQLTFKSEGDDYIARRLGITGDFEASLTLPYGEEAFDRVPTFLIDRFDDEDVYMSSPDSGSKKLPTRINTTAETVNRIVEARERTDAKAYRIVVEDEKFQLDMGDSQEFIRGSLQTQEVEGPDVNNTYLSGFKEIFSTARGRVTLRTAPGNAPLAVVWEGNDSTFRHVNGSVDIE